MNATSDLTADVLVLGDGPGADRLVSDLIQRRWAVIATAPTAAPSATVLRGARVTGAAGGPGRFTVQLASGDGTAVATVKQVVVAEAAATVPRFERYGLTAGPQVISLSDATAREAPPLSGKVAFLMGLDRASDPETTRRVMTAAAAVHDNRRGSAYVLTKNLAVAGEGLEALYRSAKQAGVTVIKFTATRPAFRQDADGPVSVAFEDEVTRRPFRLTPDLIVVDEDPSPSTALADLAALLGLHRDDDGYLQKPNVHREGVFTNRRGVYAIGDARGVFSPQTQSVDADEAALAIDRRLRGLEDPRLPAAEIDRSHCIKCLTCYRLCPYGAIQLDTRPDVMPDACESCGLCRAACPREAISLAPLERDAVTAQIAGHAAGDRSPRIIAFCCSRSAARAWRSAQAGGLTLPEGLTVVEVPCAGGIAPGHVLSAFTAPAHGVLVLTCHVDNCHSEIGNRSTHERISALQATLSTMGVDPSRLAVRTLAGNMGAAFAATVSEFEATLADLGPDIRKGNRS